MLLIDGDIMLYNAIHKTVVYANFDDEWVGPWLDMKAAKARIDAFILKLKRELEVGEITVCWSDHEGCFRYDVDSTYKHTRTGKKPGGWYALEEYVDEVYPTRRLPRCEADDVLGIMATTNPGSIIVSDDKDLRCIPGKLYTPRQAKLTRITTRQADLFHLRQTLEGDRVDDYPGCPGVGEKTALKILQPFADRNKWDRKAQRDAWKAVVDRYEQAGLTEETALTQARLARILRKTEWNTKKQTVKLWTP